MAKSKADQLKEKVNIPQMDEERETEATRSRMSKSRYKSGLRGPRDYKLTVPVPSSLNKEVRDICALLDVNPMDLINEYLEDFVKKNESTLKAIQKAREEYQKETE